VVRHFHRSVLSDIMPDLILMWQALAEGWTPPPVVTAEDYRALRHAQPSALRGFAGFGCSFGAGWFKGYATDTRPGRVSFAVRAARGIAPRVAAIRGAEIRCASYTEARPMPGDVVYCDPPYAGTTGYRGTPPFDHAAFWGAAERWARQGVHVYVSEFAAPAGWRAVWSAPHANQMRGGGGARTDALFHLS
jgi:DNA adenine methylase